MSGSFGFDSDFVVCSTVRFEPVAEQDVLEVHTCSVQTCAQLWDPEKVPQITGQHSKKPHKKVQTVRGTLPYHHSRYLKGNKGHWREIRGLDSHPQTVPHSASVLCLDGVTSLSEGEKKKRKNAAVKCQCLWSIDKMQTHQNVFSFSIPFLKWNIMVSFRLGAATRCQWEVRNNSNKFIFLPKVVLAAWGSANQRQITKVWISSVPY